MFGTSWFYFTTKTLVFLLFDGKAKSVYFKPRQLPSHFRRVPAGAGLPPCGLVQKVFDYVKTKNKSEIEYLWMRYPSYGAFRHKDNQKWYGIVMDIPRSKLGLPGDEIVDVLDIYERSGYQEIARPESVVHSTMNKFYLRELFEIL